MGHRGKANPKSLSHAAYGRLSPTNITLCLCLLCFLLFKAFPCFFFRLIRKLAKPGLRGKPKSRLQRIITRVRLLPHFHLPVAKAFSMLVQRSLLPFRRLAPGCASDPVGGHLVSRELSGQ